ncbi:MAG: DUF2334 domain-containing protein [Chthoniobacterales bacterium]
MSDLSTKKNTDGPRVLLKLDDMVSKDGTVPGRWKKLKAYTDSQNIPISVGVITNSLEEDSPKYIEELKKWHADGNVEFWNHGYDHRRWDEDGIEIAEFGGSGLEHQREHIAKGQRLAHEKLGFRFVTFGAPFNRIDSDTITALDAHPEISFWLYGLESENSARNVLKRHPKINMEEPVIRPNFKAFYENYATSEAEDLLILQGHPPHWEENDFEQFTKIIERLKKDNARFILPRDTP